VRTPVRTGGPGDLLVEILESKLYEPTLRRGVVPRPQLLDRLRAARGVPTVAVVAPAGYGKTTLLALWADADDRSFAWLSLDRHDNDPIVLLTHLAVALDRVSPLPGRIFAALRTPGVSIPASVVPRLGAALALLPDPLVLVVDDVHHLEDGPALDALVSLVDHVQGAAQIALVGRAMPVPLARHRAQGRVVEIGTADLTFGPDAARSLLQAAGADVSDQEAGALALRTEGWAAGLYLAALSRTGTRRGALLAAGGEDRLLADYLQSELLDGLSQGDVDFLTRTSVLDRLCGPLCDATLQRSGSAAELERLEHSNLFLVPLDGRRRWYRYHPLFRDLLRTRLARDGGEQSRDLLLRAADWYEADGAPEIALHYAQDAEDVDRVARIALALAQPMYAAGRSDTVLRWFAWVDDRGAAARYPALAAVTAYICALTGRPAAADRWADVAERSAGGLAVEDALLTMWLTTLRGMMCRRGVEHMRREVEDPARVPGAGSAADREYAVRVFLDGVASLLLGDVETAEARVLDATELIEETRRTPLLSVVLAYRALLCMAREDWTAAEAPVQRALAVIRGGHTESHITSALVFAVAARTAVHRGDVHAARAHLMDAQRLRPLLSHALPWYSVETLLQAAEVRLLLGDSAGARVVVRDAEAVLRRRPDLGALGKRTDELRGRIAARGTSGTEATTLTSAELRVLPLLLTHLTLSGIADRLFLSRHTVKSQVWSLYGKLGAHTRTDAVARARDLGLLDS
jgi:LuxR family maltose regulon positive regulatory protein